jgi:hypothetical protein
LGRSSGRVMARRRPEWKPVPRFAEAMGADRIGTGWVGIGIATAAFGVIGAALLSIGAPEPLLAIGPILLTLAGLCATTRRVAIDLDRGEVLLIRTLLSVRYVRRWPLHHVRRVAVTFTIAKPKHSASDGTLAGDQIHGSHDVHLRGLIRLRIAWFHASGDPPSARAEAEGLALALAGRLGVPAEREGYVPDTWPDGRAISRPVRGHVERIAGDPAAAARMLEARLAAIGNAP